MTDAEKCIERVIDCLEKAQADRSRKEKWIDEAVLWLQKSRDGGAERFNTISLLEIQE